MGVLKRLMKYLVLGVVVLAAAAGGAYVLGWRIQLDGGGGVHIKRPISAAAQAEAIEAHRAAQRAQAPASAGTASAGEPAGPVGPVAPNTPAGSAGSAAPVAPVTPVALAAPGAEWSNFRGPARNGTYSERPVRTDWPAAGLTPMWKQPIGAGYASFVVGNGRAYTIEQRANEEVVAAYDPATGRELWTNRWDALFSESMGGDGPRATPTWADGRVYALGATGEFRVLDDATGRIVWRKNILEDNSAANLQWGVSSSPLIVGQTVVVVAGGPGNKSVVAYDRQTGSRVWSVLDDRAAYSSPMLVTLAGVPQIVVALATRVVGLTPDRGTLLWQFPWRTQYDVNAAQPIVIGDNRLFYSSGYGTGAAVMEITRAGDGFNVREVWKNIFMKNQFTSSVLYDGNIYGLDEAILACVDAATGERKWKGGRYGYGQVVLANGHLIVTTEDGDIALVRATPEGHQEVVRFSAVEGKTWNHPSFANGILLVRSLQEMAAFDLRR